MAAAEVEQMDDDGRVIWCVGAESAETVELGVDWELSKGELLRGVIDGLAEDEVLNDGQ
ncbi:MAG: hypothetical protein J6386_19245 [Candidatus Synoicihabitans palmerolidicus]|nr:hypothetical protein [Candidatus Synoicihabitans palmerolidicus]